MNSVSRTLYIPLYGKAYVSQRGLFLRDPRAEAIWAAEGFALKGKAASKWLAYYMGMRAAVFDAWVKEAMEADPETVVLHIGCGLDSRSERVERDGRLWYDVDVPEVIAERRRYYAETEEYRMVEADIREEGWLCRLPKGRNAVIVMEGVCMYLSPEELRQVLGRWSAHFGRVRLLMDVYSEFAARASRYKNPVNAVGVTRVYGCDHPQELAKGTGLSFVREHDMTPEGLIQRLRGSEQAVFRTLYAGKLARGLYRLYEYKTGRDQQAR